MAKIVQFNDIITALDDQNKAMVTSMNLTEEDLQREIDHELWAHNEAREDFLREFTKVLERGDAVKAKPLKNVIQAWSEAMVEKLLADFYALDNSSVWRKSLFHLFDKIGLPFNFDAARAVVECAIPHLVNEVFVTSSVKKQMLSNSVDHIGRSLEIDLRCSITAKMFPKEWAKQEKYAKIDSRVQRKYKKAIVERVAKELASDNGFNMWQMWNSKEFRQVGMKMITLFEAVTGGLFEYREGAQSHKSKHSSYLLNVNEEWRQRIEDEIEYLSSQLNVYYPTLIPPKRWTSASSGGYWAFTGVKPSLFTGNYESKRTRKRQAKCSYPQVLEAVNLLQETPFCINNDVLDLIKCLLRGADKDGVSIGNISHGEWQITTTHKIFNVISRIQKWPDHVEIKDPKDPILDQATYNMVARNYHQDQAIKRSLHMKEIIKLVGRIDKLNERCNHFYLPYALDFRGRAYTRSFIDPQGDDLNKALILCANKKPLGERGLHWLKFMVATLWEEDGIDKAHPDERVAYIDAHRGEIEFIVDQPFDSLHLWGQCPNRFQFWAGCKELVNAWRSGNPFEYPCGFTVAFDGSCSGIQHYSAMTRDDNAGKMVNLTDDVRHDIYGYVAKQTNDLLRIQRSAMNAPLITIKRPEFKQNGGMEWVETQVRETFLADNWLNYNGGKGVDRSVVKQNVMTYTYAATDMGRISQLRKKITSVFDSDTSFDKTDDLYLYRYDHTTYLQNFVKAEIEKAAGRGALLMEYLKELARACCESGINPEHFHNKSTQEIDEMLEKIRMEEAKHQLRVSQAKLAGKPKPKLNSKLKNSLLGNQSVFWITPDGLPVWQMVYEEAESRVLFKDVIAGTSFIHSGKGSVDDIALVFNKTSEVLDARACASGIAPNFIHSMDATHLRMTVRACAEKGVYDFVMVHDSFGTIPADAQVMHDTVREQFVELYTNPKFDMLAQLDQFARTNLPEEVYQKLPPLPERGTLDVSEVLKSTYAFI